MKPPILLTYGSSLLRNAEVCNFSPRFPGFFVLFTKEGFLSVELRGMFSLNSTLHKE